MSKYTIELRKICEIATRDRVESWFKDYDLYDYTDFQGIVCPYNKKPATSVACEKVVIDYSVGVDIKRSW